MVKIVESSEFNSEIGEGKVLVDFYADWCGPCKMISPVLEEFDKQNEDIKVIKVNVDNSQDIAEQFNVMSIPTLLYIENGDIVNTTRGFQSIEMLEAFVGK